MKPEDTILWYVILNNRYTRIVSIVWNCTLMELHNIIKRIKKYNENNKCVIIISKMKLLQFVFFGNKSNHIFCWMQFHIEYNFDSMHCTNVSSGNLLGKTANSCKNFLNLKLNFKSIVSLPTYLGSRIRVNFYGPRNFIMFNVIHW